MDYTLLKKHCERARHRHLLSEPVTAFSESENNGDVRTGGLSEAIAAILFANDSAEDPTGATAADRFTTDNHFNTLGEALEEAVYDKLVVRLQAEDVEVFHRRQKGSSGPNRGSAVAVPRFVVTQRSFSVGPRKFTCRSTHPGNAAVLFYIGRAIRLGFINTIWDQSIGGVVRRHVLMTPLKLLDSEDAAKNPFLNWPGLACGIVYNVFEDDTVISPNDVIAHAAFRVRPTSTFSIDKETVVFHSLDRGRKIPLFC